MGEGTIRWRCGCKDADHCESPAKTCQKVQRLEDEAARLRAALDATLGAFDPEWPGACGQDCFDTSDGHGYERQEAARRQARAALR